MKSGKNKLLTAPLYFNRSILFSMEGVCKHWDTCKEVYEEWEKQVTHYQLYFNPSILLSMEGICKHVNRCTEVYEEWEKEVTDCAIIFQFFNSMLQLRISSEPMQHLFGREDRRRRRKPSLAAILMPLCSSPILILTLKNSPQNESHQQLWWKCTNHRSNAETLVNSKWQ